MLWFSSSPQRVLEISGRIPLRSAGHDCEAKYLCPQAALIVVPFRSPRASQLCASISSSPGDSSVSDRTPTNRWKDISLKAPEDLSSVVRATWHPSSFRAIRAQRLQRYCQRRPWRPVCAHVSPGKDQGWRLGCVWHRARRTRIRKPNSGIDAKRKRALLAMPPIRQAPVLCSVGLTNRCKPPPSESLRGLISPSRFGTSHLSTACWYLVSAIEIYQQICQQKSWMSARRRADVSGRLTDRKTAGN